MDELINEDNASDNMSFFFCSQLFSCIHLGRSSGVQDFVNELFELPSRVLNEIHSADAGQLGDVAIVELEYAVALEREAGAMVSPAAQMKMLPIVCRLAENDRMK